MSVSCEMTTMICIACKSWKKRGEGGLVNVIVKVMMMIGVKLRWGPCWLRVVGADTCRILIFHIFKPMNQLLEWSPIMFMLDGVTSPRPTNVSNTLKSYLFSSCRYGKLCHQWWNMEVVQWNNVYFYHMAQTFHFSLVAPCHIPLPKATIH